MITIVDYGMGNLRSVQKACEHVGAPAQIVRDPQAIAEAERLILPGVGAFRDAIAELRKLELVAPLLDYIRADRPFLGICLGLQLLFDVSYEDGEWTGLAAFPGEVVRFPDQADLKVPHMGWNSLQLTQPNAALFQHLPPDPSVYFVHSYYVCPRDTNLIAAKTDYGQPFTSAIGSGRVFATQFHPEKSQKIGLQLLKNFAELT
ncbi:imidazole glycerol phosphate synthase subunit HisH [bacterium]|nr:imidazole glycerol phosphate synthase subunit HisH [bacterium]